MKVVMVSNPNSDYRLVDHASAATSLTLLARVKANDAQAWQRLSDIYGPFVYHWCRKSGFQAADAADIVQEVFYSVARRHFRLPEGANKRHIPWLALDDHSQQDSRPFSWSWRARARRSEAPTLSCVLRRFLTRGPTVPPTLTTAVRSGFLFSRALSFVRVRVRGTVPGKRSGTDDGGRTKDGRRGQRTGHIEGRSPSGQVACAAPPSRRTLRSSRLGDSHKLDYRQHLAASPVCVGEKISVTRSPLYLTDRTKTAMIKQRESEKRRIPAMPNLGTLTMASSQSVPSLRAIYWRSRSAELTEQDSDLRSLTTYVTVCDMRRFDE